MLYCWSYTYRPAVISITSKQVQPHKQFFFLYFYSMSQTAQDVPLEIQELLQQQEEINKKLEGWKKEQEEKKRKEKAEAQLREFTTMLSKKRAFNGIRMDFDRPLKLQRCFHNISVIQKKEEELANERALVKEDCLKDLNEYLKKKEE